MNKHFEEYIEQWLQKAKNDLLSAQRLIEIEPMILDNACFHCQQAAEKAVKGYLCYNKFEIEKTHDIDNLIALASRYDSDFVSFLPKLKNINKYAVQARYPDFEMPEIEEVQYYYALAKDIFAFVKERIVWS